MKKLDLPISFGVFAVIESLLGLFGAIFNAPMWCQYNALIGTAIGLGGMWATYILERRK